MNRISLATRTIFILLCMVSPVLAVFLPDPAIAATAHVSQVRVFDNGTIRYEKGDRPIVRRELHYVEFYGKRAYVEFNDGSAWSFAPCEYEDSTRCYWNAGKRGNRIGMSFIRLGGRFFRL